MIVFSLTHAEDEMRINHDKKSELYNVESRDRDRKIIKYLQNVIGNRIKDATNFDKLILI